MREANFDEGLDTIMDVKGRCVTLADRNPGIGIETFFNSFSAGAALAFLNQQKKRQPNFDDFSEVIYYEN